MIRLCLPVRPIYANCYLVGDPETRQGVVIDPGGEAARILDEAARLGLTLTRILLTHGHLDHTSATAEVRDATGAPVCIHPADADLLRRPDLAMAALMGLQDPAPVEPDQLLEDGSNVEVGSTAFRVLHTPGHTPGSICLALEDEVFTGDTIFAGGVGRTDLGGSMSDLVATLRDRIATLPDDTVLLPGHEGQTTVWAEKAGNPFLQAALRGTPMW